MSWVFKSLLFSALTYLVTALGFALSRGGVFKPAAGQLAVEAGFTIGAAALAAALSWLPRGERLAPAAWVGVNLGVLSDPVWGLLAAAFTLWALRPADWRKRPTDLGLLLTFALGAALLLMPRVASRLPLPVSVDEGALGLSAVVAVLGAARLVAGRVGRPIAVASLTAGLAVVALLPLASNLGRGGLPTSARAARVERPDVFLLVLDTVRADHLSVYGYERPTTPALERLVKEHPGTVVYDIAFSNGTWTLPSHASLFTGRLPSAHGVHEANVFGPDGLPLQRTLEAPTTLAEACRDQGYMTGFVYANGWLDLVVGLDRGFDHYRYPKTVQGLRSLGNEALRSWLPSWFRVRPVQAAQVNAELLEFVDACEPGPCLAIANYMDAHAPYLPSEANLGRFGDGEPEPADRPYYQDSNELLTHLSGLYDESIRTLDDGLGVLFAELERRGVLRDAWVIITSDHGEAFREHGEVEHGSALYGEVTQVPLIVKPPAGTQLPATSAAVDLLDVARTVVAIAEGPALGRGRDLRHLEGEPSRVIIEMFDNTNKEERKLGARAGRPGRAVASGSLKLVDHDGSVELFDLASDPREKTNLAPERADLVAQLTAAGTAAPQAPAKAAAPAAPAAPAQELELTVEQERQLRALGYVE